MTFQPTPTRSGYVALGVAVVFGTAAIYLFNLMLLPHSERLATAIFPLNIMLSSDNLVAVFKILLGFLLAALITLMALYYVIIALKSTYYLDRNGLMIQWGLTQYRIPLEMIEAIIPGQEASSTARFWETNVAGWRWGRGQTADHRPLRFYTTAALTDSMLVTTPEQTYVISPRQPENFFQAWRQRRALGTTQQWAVAVHRSWPLNSPLLADHLAWWFLGLAALLWLAMAGYLTFNFADLPASIPIHFDAAGRADRIADKMNLLVLPAAGGLVWLVNALLGELAFYRDRLAAYFLWAAALVMQCCLGVALWMIVP